MEHLELKLKHQIKALFDTNKEIQLNSKDQHTVNTIFTFNFDSQGYYVKVLTRPPTCESEYYRFEKEAKLFQEFNSRYNTKGINDNSQVSVPTPKIIHIETDTRKIGYKFIIMEEVEGVTLSSIWDSLSTEQKNPIIKDLASIISNIHSIEYEMFGNIEEYDCPRRFYSAKSYYKAQTRRIMRLLGNTKLLPVELVTESGMLIEKLLEKATFSDKAYLVHNDLNLTNIIVTEQQKHSIKAILDFEWAIASDPLFDLFSIEEDWLISNEEKIIFYDVYFKNQTDFSTDNFLIEKTIKQLVGFLETTALGWVYFHPTKENLQGITKSIQSILAKKKDFIE